MQFPAVSMKIDGEFVIDVDRQFNACGDKHGIKVLCLSLPQPPREFLAAATGGFTENIPAGITG